MSRGFFNFSLHAQAALGTLRDGSRGLKRVPESVRSSERHLQLDPSLEWYTGTTDGRVGRDELYLQPRVLQVRRIQHVAKRSHLLNISSKDDSPDERRLIQS